MEESKKTLIVRATLPRIQTDSPKFSLSTKDGKFTEIMDVNPMHVKLMRGQFEAYFEIVIGNNKILSLKPVSESKYEGVSDVGLTT